MNQSDIDKVKKFATKANGNKIIVATSGDAIHLVQHTTINKCKVEFFGKHLFFKPQRNQKDVTNTISIFHLDALVLAHYTPNDKPRWAMRLDKMITGLEKPLYSIWIEIFN